MKYIAFSLFAAFAVIGMLLIGASASEPQKRYEFIGLNFMLDDMLTDDKLFCVDSGPATFACVRIPVDHPIEECEIVGDALQCEIGV